MWIEAPAHHRLSHLFFAELTNQDAGTHTVQNNMDSQEDLLSALFWLY